MGIKKRGGAGGWDGSSKGAACLPCLGEMHKSQVPFWGALGGTPQRDPPPRGEGAARPAGSVLGTKLRTELKQPPSHSGAVPMPAELGRQTMVIAIKRQN